MNAPIPYGFAEQIARGNSILWWGWDASRGPTRMEVIQTLASECNYPLDAPLNLPSVASFFQDETGLGRQALIRRLMELLENEPPDPDLIQMMHLPFTAIVTPRYDSVVERAVRGAGRRLVVIVEDQDVPFWDRDKTLVLKAYGSLERPDSLTITQDDYDHYALRKPLVSKLLHILLAINHMLLYKPWLDDVNFRRVYQEILFHTGRFQRMRYALVDHTEMSNYWRKQGIVYLPSEEGETLRNLLATVQQIEVPLSLAPVVQLGRRPYKFLDFYTRDDKDLFFGRNRQIREVGELILSHRLVVLYGQSGVGKTSLILAGLMPTIEAYDVQSIYVRCGSDPEAAVKREALALWPQNQDLPSLDQPLAELLAQLSRAINRPLTVFIDQFEEFGKLAEVTKQEAFLAALGDWWSYEPAPAQIVLSLREDYLGILDRLASHIPNPLQITFRLHNLGTDEARLAIEKPAERVGLSYEPGLVAQILNELLQAGGKVNIMPPQLQIVCNRLFDELRCIDNRAEQAVLSSELYRRLGRAERILADYADHVLDQFAVAKREQAKRVLKALVSAKGERRPLSAGQIAGDTELAMDVTRDLLHDLDQHRLVRRVETVDGEQFEIIHDYLAPKVSSWFDDAERKLREIQELLQREASDRESYGSLLTLEKYQAAYELRESLAPTLDVLELLMASALYHSYDPDYWCNLVVDQHGEDEVNRLLREFARADDPSLRDNAFRLQARLRSGASSVGVMPLDRKDWALPSLDLLSLRSTPSSLDQRSLQETINIIEEVFHSKEVSAWVAEASCGPTVTRFGFELQPRRTRRSAKDRSTIKRFLSQENELQLALGIHKVRLLPMIPGKPGLVGVEVPNSKATMVRLRGIFEDCPGRRSQILPIVLGESACGDGVACEDLIEVMHLLIAGEPGSGRTSFLKAILAALLFLPPSKVRFFVITANPAEYSALNKTIPHMILPIVHEPRQAVQALQKVQLEIRNRQNTLSRLNLRTLAQYHQRARVEALADLPFWAVIIDDYEEVMTSSKSEVHRILDELTKIGRQTGLHLVVSTRRPLAQVIPSDIKANFPSRVGFLQSSRDSKLIFDETPPPTSKLIGSGDMFVRTPSSRTPIRLQGCFVSESELQALVEHWHRQWLPEPEPDLDSTEISNSQQETTATVSLDELEDRDVYTSDVVDSGTPSPIGDRRLQEAQRIIQTKGSISISLLRDELGLNSSEAIQLIQDLRRAGLI